MLLINLHHSWHYLSLKNWNPGYKLEPWLAGKFFLFLPGKKRLLRSRTQLF